MSLHTLNQYNSNPSNSIRYCTRTCFLKTNDGNTNFQNIQTENAFDQHVRTKTTPTLCSKLRQAQFPMVRQHTSVNLGNRSKPAFLKSHLGTAQKVIFGNQKATKTKKPDEWQDVHRKWLRSVLLVFCKRYLPENMIWAFSHFQPVEFANWRVSNQFFKLKIFNIFQLRLPRGFAITK